MVSQVIDEAKKVGVDYIVVPGTDVETSKKAIEIANQYDNVYAAVGIHPHHVFEMQTDVILGSASDSRIVANNDSGQAGMTKDIQEIKNLLKNKKVVAVGEVGLDRHVYEKTKYQDYGIYPEFIEGQKDFLRAQIKLAITYDKSLILHNREARSPSLRSGVSGRAKKDILKVLNETWSPELEGKTVFHCCEPDMELLEFAQKHNMYIGVDGDITHRADKQEFIKKVPIEMLVLETDSPFLLPRPPRKPSLRGVAGVAEPLRFPNEPKNIKLIAECIAQLRNSENRLVLSEVEGIIGVTTDNAKKLFGII